MRTEEPCGEAHPLLRHHLVARAAITVQATTTVMLGWGGPSSLTARLLESGGQIAHAVLLLMSVLVAFAWLDVLANDVLRRGVHTMVRWEALGYMALGGCYWMQAFAGAGVPASDGTWILVANYILAGAVCTWYGWARAVRGVQHG